MKHITLQSKMSSLVAFLLSIAFVVMMGCDEPNKPNNGGGGTTPTSLAAPTISTHPASQKISEGSTASLSVKATHPSGAALFYQWQKAAKGSKDFTNVANATSESYTTPTLTKADDGTQYRVVVTATNESKETKSVTSSIATITVSSSTSSLAAPSITKQPVSDTISEGATANLSVEVTQISGVKFSYQWQKAAKGSNDFTDVKGANAGSYTTPTLTATDNGTQYRVVVTATNESKETKSVTSDVAIITVSTSPSLAAPTITKQPTSQKIDEGNTASLSVKATAPSGATLSYQWQKKEKDAMEFTNVTGATDTIYTTPTFTAAENGVQYRVVVIATKTANITSTATSNTATLTVTPLPLPTITTQPKSQSIEEGATANLSVTATPPAGATLSYQWQKAAKGSNDFKDIAGANASSYNTPVLAYADNGVQYRVVVIATKTTNITSTATSNIVTITVSTSPPVVSTKIEWTHKDGTKQYTDVPSGGVLMWSVLTNNKDDIKSVNVIPSGVTSIGENAFAQCKNLTSISIPNTVTSMGGYVFDGCTALTSITLPSAIKSIGSGTFYNCTSLTSITIPSNVTSIGNNAFNGCSSLTNVRVEATTPPTAGTDMFKDTHASLIIRVPDAKVNDYRTAPNWITYKHIIYGFNEPIVPKIQWTHTNGSPQYTDAPADGILLSTTLTSNMTDIKSVDIIPSSITSIGASAFFNCSNLTSITLPDKLTNIGERAFFNCSSLTSITIPSSVTSIGALAFSRCTKLIRINIPSGIKTIEKETFKICEALTSVTIPNGVTIIKEQAFNGCLTLASIIIPSSVTNIESLAFEGCKALASVRVERETPPSIGGMVFGDTAANLSITVPSASVNAYKGAINWSTYAGKITGY